MREIDPCKCANCNNWFNIKAEDYRGMEDPSADNVPVCCPLCGDVFKLSLMSWNEAFRNNLVNEDARKMYCLFKSHPELRAVLIEKE